MTALQITTTSQDGTTRIELTGELDIATGPDLEQALETQLGQPGRRHRPRPSRRDVHRLVGPARGARREPLGHRGGSPAASWFPGDGQVLRVIRLAQVEDRLDLGDG